MKDYVYWKIFICTTYRNPSLEDISTNCNEISVDKYIKSFNWWNQLLIMMHGQLSGCESLREFVCITTAHSPKSFYLDFGKSLITCSNLQKPTLIGAIISLRNLPIK